MPLDTSIYQNLLRPPKSVQEYDNEAQTAQLNRLALQTEQRKADEYARNIAGESALSNALAAGGDVQNALASKGFGSKALAYAKQQQELAKAGADVEHIGAQTGKLKSETAKLDFEQREAKRHKAITDIAAFTTPQEALASLNAHEAAGDLAPEAAAAVRATIPQNPAEFPKWQIGMLQRIMGAKDVMEYKAPSANTVATNERAASEGKLNRAQAERHFNTTQDNGKGQVVQTDNGPVLVNTRTGTAQAINGPDGQPLTGVTKPLNDSQSKALLFGTRMQEAHKILDSLAKNDKVTTSTPYSRAPLIGGVVTALSSESQQMLDQAKRDFINAVLRRESGAAISPGEFDNAERQYFPQIGEGDKVAAQKAKNRQLAISGMLAEVPAKQRASITPAAAATATPLPAGWSVKEK
jgi:hypothetical protein